MIEAKELLARVGRERIGDDQIGQILFKSPPGTDGIWPHEAVRDVIEEIKSPELETALRIGMANARGVTSRSPFAGGTQEREIAEKYRKEAEVIKLQWPSTSEILRRLAKSYERQAVHEDWRVELLE